MKSLVPLVLALDGVSSHPSRGAWIEIRQRGRHFMPRWRRTPHGVRGLKFTRYLELAPADLSHPSRGAWIEISCNCASLATGLVAPLTGCVD